MNSLQIVFRRVFQLKKTTFDHQFPRNIYFPTPSRAIQLFREERGLKRPLVSSIPDYEIFPERARLWGSSKRRFAFRRESSRYLLLFFFFPSLRWKYSRTELTSDSAWWLGEEFEGKSDFWRKADFEKSRVKVEAKRYRKEAKAQSFSFEKVLRKPRRICSRSNKLEETLVDGKIWPFVDVDIYIYRIFFLN